MDFKIAVHAVHPVRLFSTSSAKYGFACAFGEAFHGMVKNCPLNRRPVRKTSVHEVSFAVPSRTRTAYFNGFKINACEIRDDFRRRSNAIHHPVIYQSVKLLHRTVAYPAVLYVLMPDDEADRVLLCTGHHRQKSERICGTADFSPQSTHSSLTQKPTSRKYGGKKLMKSKLRNEINICI